MENLEEHPVTPPLLEEPKTTEVAEVSKESDKTEINDKPFVLDTKSIPETGKSI